MTAAALGATAAPTLFGGDASFRDVTPASKSGDVKTAQETYAEFSNPFVISGSGSGFATQTLAILAAVAIGGVLLWKLVRK